MKFADLVWEAEEALREAKVQPGPGLAMSAVGMLMQAGRDVTAEVLAQVVAMLWVSGEFLLETKVREDRGPKEGA